MYWPGPYAVNLYMPAPAPQLESNFIFYYRTMTNEENDLRLSMLYPQSFPFFFSPVLSCQHGTASQQPYVTEEFFLRQEGASKMSYKQHNAKYAKKNSEANVVNQIFSYVSSRAKSQKIVTILLAGDQEKMHSFYKLMREIKKQNKKYINRVYLRDLILLRWGHFSYDIFNKNSHEGSFTIEEMRRMLRILIYYYLRVSCVPNVLTSTKLGKESMMEHLQRKREVQAYLEKNIQST